MPSSTFTYASTSDTVLVNGAHFGLNHLFTRDDVNGSSQSDYEAVVESVVNNVIRYPGGTIAEAWFDPENPNSTSGTNAFDGSTTNSLTPLVDIIQYSAESNSELLIVIPTGRYFNETLLSSGYISAADKEVIRDFVEYVITHPIVVSGQVQIDGFEIGNEWYQSNFSWSVEQFGELSSQIAKVIQQRIDSVDNGVDPKIFVQAGRTDVETQAIRDQFGSVEYDALDGVTTHFYTTNGNGNPMGAGGGVQRRLNDIYDSWNDPNSSVDIPVLVSEWNVGGNGPDNTPLSGLMRNAPLMRTFSEMIENGVDMATFWTAVAAGNGAESLSLQNNGSELTPTGYLYRMLSENVIGTKLQTQNSDFNLPGGHGYSMVFESSEKTVIYFVSGTDQQLDVTANLAALIDQNSHVHAIRLGMVGGDNVSYYGDGTITHLSETDMDPDGNEILSVSLGAYELIQIVVTDQSSNVGVNLYGDDQNVTDDELIGSINDDTLTGNAGIDNLIGGPGNDVYFVSDSDDSIVENANEGIDHVNASVSFSLKDFSQNLETLTLTEGGNLNGTGNRLDNTITGNSGNNILNGAWGNDTLFGGAGNDTFLDDNGADHMVGGRGNDTYRIDNSGDSIVENADEGNDHVNASVSFSLKDFSQNLETLTLTEGGNLNGTGNRLDNTITGNSGNNILNGAWGNDTLFGGAGNDTFLDGKGADRMVGGRGNDTFLIDSGDDRMTGGLGGDTFVFLNHFGHDVVTDFNITQTEERIDLSAVLSITDFTDLSSNHLSEVGGNTIINAGDGNTITLEGVDLSSLTVEAFIF